MYWQLLRDLDGFFSFLCSADCDFVSFFHHGIRFSPVLTSLFALSAAEVLYDNGRIQRGWPR
jgi:hypothetical protein